MAHKFIVGMTASGKTTLAKMIASQMFSRGNQCLVLDPLLDEWPDGCEVTEKSDEFLKLCKSKKRCILFVDEGASSVGRYNNEMQWLATQSRHWGHVCVFISQGVTQIAPIIRQQCDTFIVFACGQSNRKLIAEETDNDLVIDTKLKKGEFWHISRFEPIKRGKIHFPENGEKAEVSKLTVTYNIEKVRRDD